MTFARSAILLPAAIAVLVTTSALASTPEPASRVVTLAPHLAELLFDIGAGDLLVGVSAYTDYPEAAAQLPVIGDAFMIDREQLAVLQPDVLLAWQSGTPRHVVDQLRDSGYRVELIRTQGIADVASALRELGELTGQTAEADAVADRYLQEMSELADTYQDHEEIRVFYQISKRPLYSVNGDHYISELIELCGGQNIFADIGDLAPLIDVEAVIDRNPEVMLAGEDSTREAFDIWDQWPGIAANRLNNRFFMPAAEIGRATTRLVIAAEAVCSALVTARENRAEGFADDD